MTDTYIFDTGTDLGGQHVTHLEALLDTVTTQSLRATGIQPGQRCLEIGAGGGSIARWLADRTGTTGSVIATDLDTQLLRQYPGMEVHRHDINEGLPAEGPYDLIHARLVLMHLPRREQILDMLAASLAPGGWLVLGEFSDRPLHVLSAPSTSDRELFARIQSLAASLSPTLGLSWQWAAKVPEQMARAGLVDLHAVEYSLTSAGGTDGALLHRNLNLQGDAVLRGAGATIEELARYRELLTDPSFKAWFYQFVCVRARRPA